MVPQPYAGVVWCLGLRRPPEWTIFYFARRGTETLRVIADWRKNKQHLQASEQLGSQISFHFLRRPR